MKNFTLYQNGVVVFFSNGITTIHFNKDSGKIFYRLKIDTLWDTKHPGIYIGNDQRGTHYFMHNHYQAGQPGVATMQEFTQGRPYFPYETEISNSWIQIIENGLNEVLRGKSYHTTDYNCQTFVNRACNDIDHSEDLNKWIGRIAAGSAILVCLNLFNKNF